MVFIDHRNVSEGTQFATDVCVVGAGAAGITAAIELARAGVDVLLLPGGGLRYSKAYQRLYIGTDDMNIPLERSRIRRFGGTTSVWGGRCIPFDPIDFDYRPYVEHSGWPIEWSDLQEYYRRAQEHLDIGSNFSFQVRDLLPRAPAHLIEGFDDDVLETHRVEKWSLPTNLGRKYEQELRESPNVRVVMDGHLTRIQCAEAQGVSGLACVTKDGTRFVCSADAYVLAMGAFETTRHLLHPTRFHPDGIGNRSGLLGRYFMTHISGSIANVSIHEDRRVVNEYEKDTEGVYCRRRLQISADVQRKEGILNFAAFLHEPPLHDASHRNPVLSLIFVAKGLRAVALRIPAEYSVELAYGRFGFSDYLAHARNIVRGIPLLIASAPGLIYRRLIRRRKLPSVILRRHNNRFTLHYHVEHAPHPDSRLTLSNDVDEHGLRRLHVSMAYHDIDVESILTAHELIRERLEEAGAGSLTYVGDDLRQRVESQIGFGGHQMGTTRMASSEQDGIVDPNCKVFGMDNLYVAGPSVFPTGSHANPVLTIVAMAIRLADHLSR